MSRDDILFSIIGLLLGFILGYMLTNSYNQTASAPPSNAPAANAPGPQQDSEGPPTEQEIAQAQQAAQSQPNNYEAQIMAGDLFARANRYDESLSFFTKANKLKPDDIDPMMALGNVYFAAALENNAHDKWPLAEKWFTAVLARDPSLINVRTTLGRTFMFREPPNYDRAIQEYLKVLAVDPKHEATLANLTFAYAKKKNAAEAQATLTKLAQANPQHKALPELREEIAKLK